MIKNHQIEPEITPMDKIAIIQANNKSKVIDINLL
jgi:hypothetical protein